jgi:hypothetical protein
LAMSAWYQSWLLPRARPLARSAADCGSPE